MNAQQMSRTMQSAILFVLAECLAFDSEAKQSQQSCCQASKTEAFFALSVESIKQKDEVICSHFRLVRQQEEGTILLIHPCIKTYTPL